MNLIKYFGKQCFLFVVVILINYYLGGYISKPFTSTDFIAMIVWFALLFLVISVYDKFGKRLKPIFLLNKILLSILALFISGVFIGIVTGALQFV